MDCFEILHEIKFYKNLENAFINSERNNFIKENYDKIQQRKIKK